MREVLEHPFFGLGKLAGKAPDFDRPTLGQPLPAADNTVDISAYTDDHLKHREELIAKAGAAKTPEKKETPIVVEEEEEVEVVASIEKPKPSPEKIPTPAPKAPKVSSSPSPQSAPSRPVSPPAPAPAARATPPATARTRPARPSPREPSPESSLTPSVNIKKKSTRFLKGRFKKK